MITWNIQYISRSRLAGTFEQLMLDSTKGDILIRIHTAIHFGDEAVELARFIKELVPNAHIVGTSTSGTINAGKLSNNQCIISVSVMSFGSIKTAKIPTHDEKTGSPYSTELLCQSVKEEVICKDTKLLLTFVTAAFPGILKFIDKCNDRFPDVKMIGGLANVPDIRTDRSVNRGYVFDENGYTNKALLVASINGESFDTTMSYVTGAEVVGNEMTITDSFGECILSLDGNDAAAEYRKRVGGVLGKHSDYAYVFPYVYSDNGDTPFLVMYDDSKSLDEIYPRGEAKYDEMYSAHPDVAATCKRELIRASHEIINGSKIKRAFIHDRKIVSDNQKMFNKISSFEKAQTLFGYSCITRPNIYSNCAKWEISVYENTNICGCLTGGEIFHNGEKNVFGNCAFIVAALGEEAEAQAYNPYVFLHTEMLEKDNEELLGYLTAMEGARKNADESVKEFIHECASKLLYSNDTGIMNVAAMNMDIKLKGYDRICMISVLDIESMNTVFSEDFIDLTYRNYVKKCRQFAESKRYHIYSEEKWHIAIGARSYMVDLNEFTKDMEKLQKELFATNDEYISIIPLFCVIDNCTVENMISVYNNARLTMMTKNIQFYVCDAKTSRPDDVIIREKYHMVNVINYAIANDTIIPQYQGIYSNSSQNIEHYESLMRIMDEDGRMYYPNAFLDVARSFGMLYDSMSKIMVGKVFEHFKDLTNKSVSINLGIRDIRNRDMTEFIYDFLGTAPHPQNFVFEILENEDIDDYTTIIAFVDRIHELGGKIALDDFGSGFSNLQHVMDIHFDYLKIDGSIVKRCVDNKEAENLIALISGWKKLSEREINIIAEFVENEDIQDKMVRYGIDYSQGFLFSKPSTYILE